MFELQGGSPETVTSCFAPEHQASIVSAEDGIQLQADIREQQEIDRTVDALRVAGVSIVSMKRRELTLEEAFLDIVKEEQS